MRKILTAATAALTFAGALAATTAPVQAQTRGHGGFHGAAVRGGGFRGGGYRGGGYRGGGYGYRGGGYGGYGIGAGLAGLAIGAALANPYYGYGYGPSYDYGPGYYGYGGGCAQRVWDPYWGRWTVRYVC